MTWTASPTLGVWSQLGRTVTRPALEYLLVSGSSEAAQLAGAQQSGIDPQVDAEVSDALVIGARWKMVHGFETRAEAWGRWSHPGLVAAELGTSGVLFPLDLRDVLAGGVEWTVEWKDGKVWQVGLTGSLAGTFGVVPDDSVSPVTAGLVFGEEGSNYRHPWSGEDVFPVEHNQMWRVRGEAKRLLVAGFWSKLAFEADAGLPFDLRGPDGKSMGPTKARELLISRGWSPSTVDLLDLSEEEPGSPDRSTSPKILFDAGLGWDSPETRTGVFHLEAGCRNLLDTPYLTRFETSIGGTHWGAPRTWFASSSWSL